MSAGRRLFERADLASGAAGARLPGEAQGIRPGPADLAGDQVQVGDEVVHPRAAHVLVDAHAPEAHGAARQIAVDVGQRSICSTGTPVISRTFAGV